MAKPARKADRITIASREDADRYLSALGEIATHICQAEDEADKKMAAIREKLVDATASLIETRGLYEKALEEWATENKAELFKDGKTLTLNFGSLGFRWTPWKISVLKKLKVETVIEKLRAGRFGHLIHTVEKVDRKKAVNYDNETLERFGMKKTRKDKFFYELKQEEVKP